MDNARVLKFNVDFYLHEMLFKILLKKGYHLDMTMKSSRYKRDSILNIGIFAEKICKYVQTEYTLP